MHTPSYLEIAQLPDDQRIAELQKPDRRTRILAELPQHNDGRGGSLDAYFRTLYEYAPHIGYEPRPDQSVAACALAEGQDPAAYTYDLLAAGAGEAVLLLPAANFANNSTDAIRTMLASDVTILGLGDGGAHVGLLCDASLPTYMIQRWSNVGGGEMPVERVVKALSADTAAAVGLNDRGILAPGYRADVNVIDPATIAIHRPVIARDLPNGGVRLGQPATGYDATIVAGQVTYRNGQPTGALPGRLVRGAQERPCLAGAVA